MAWFKYCWFVLSLLDGQMLASACLRKNKDTGPHIGLLWPAAWCGIYDCIGYTVFHYVKVELLLLHIEKEAVQVVHAPG